MRYLVAGPLGAYTMVYPRESLIYLHSGEIQYLISGIHVVVENVLGYENVVGT